MLKTMTARFDERTGGLHALKETVTQTDYYLISL